MSGVADLSGRAVQQSPDFVSSSVVIPRNCCGFAVVIHPVVGLPDISTGPEHSYLPRDSGMIHDP